MKIEGLNEVLNWIKTTDLTEVSFKKGSEGFDLRMENAPHAEAPFPASNLVPITSPAVGIFRWGKPGTPKQVEEGKPVASGSQMGIVEMGTRSVQIPANAGGRVIKILVQDGTPVEYGQALFLISP